jgi:hypothetical protein
MARIPPKPNRIVGGAIALILTAAPATWADSSTGEDSGAGCDCTCGCLSPDYGPQAIAPEEVPFPLPETVYCLLQFPTPGRGSINFQTDLTLAEALAFYRTEFERLGLQERSINTAVTEDVFSLVFDGWPEETALVIQSVDLGGRININLRFEDL